jgi:RNA polymerase sigma factor for flagellar operon FliA
MTMVASRSQEEEVELNSITRDEALLECATLARGLAFKVKRRWPTVRLGECPIDDLVSEGMLAGLEAWDRFDPNMGVPFAGYVSRRMYGAMVDLQRRTEWATRRYVEKAAVGGDQVRVLLSLNEEYADGRSRIDVVEDPTAPDPCVTAVTNLQTAGVREAVARLSGRELEIITRHYFDGWPLTVFAKRYGVTASRISQIHTSALRHMGVDLEKQDLLSA